MSPLHEMGFEVTPDDVLTVMRASLRNVVNSAGVSLDALAGELFELLDHSAIARAAMDAGTDFDAQVDAGHAEIRRSLVELGALKG